MKAHFDPYVDPYDPDGHYNDKYPCGTTASWEEYNATGDWNQVTCKRCLAIKQKLDSEAEEVEKAIVDQMGDMADFWSKKENAA